MTKELLKIELRKLLSRKSVIATFLLVVFINLTYFYFFDLSQCKSSADVSLLRLLHPLYRRVPKLSSAAGALCRGGNPESGGGRRGAVPGGENPTNGRGHHYGEIFPREEAETIRGWGI